jgi:hypothetical protein
MKLYLTAAGQYAGTQKEAGKGFALELVPDNKEALIAYLNEKIAARAAPVEQPEVPSGGSANFVERPRVVAPVQPSLDKIMKASQVEDFILNEATVAQVESLFACLGTRFSELAKAVRS